MTLGICGKYNNFFPVPPEFILKLNFFKLINCVKGTIRAGPDGLY